jgi:GNAT superfamily N-acetyltransferase
MLFDYLFSVIMIKGFLVTIILLLVSIYHADAFLPAQPWRTSRRDDVVTSLRVVLKRSDLSPLSAQPLTHDEIIWKLRPPPGTPLSKRILLRLGANAIRLEAAIRGTDPPFCLCPKGGQAVLEAYYQGTCIKTYSVDGIHPFVLTVLYVYTAPYNTFPQQIGRFGITTIRGPPARPIDESVEQIYGIDLQGRHVSSAAIVYMVVDEKFRSRNVGTLALEVISTIHSIQGCDFTLLVADDDGSGKLIEWYEEHGFSQAPLLQDLLGSPGGQYGAAMMAPTSNAIDGACRIKWW